jgi:hypothetical protein
MKKCYTLIILTAILISCSSGNYESKSESAVAENASVSRQTKQAPVQSSSPQKSKKRQIIWKGSLRFQVKNVEESTLTIREIISKYNGFISSMDLTSSNYQITNKISIRVKNDKFDPLIDEIKKEAIFVDEINIESNDVTEEFIDIKSRLKTKKEVRDRYIDVLKNKAGEVKDIIEAEEAIRKITEEIEAKEGRLRYLQDKVNFSTVNVTLYEKVEFVQEPEVYEKPYVKKIIEGLKNGWSIITVLFIFLVNIWPLLILTGIIIWKWKWIKRKFG